MLERDLFLKDRVSHFLFIKVLGKGQFFLEGDRFLRDWGEVHFSLSRKRRVMLRSVMVALWEALAPAQGRGWGFSIADFFKELGGIHWSQFSLSCRLEASLRGFRSDCQKGQDHSCPGYEPHAGATQKPVCREQTWV